MLLHRNTLRAVPTPGRGSRPTAWARRARSC